VKKLNYFQWDQRFQKAVNNMKIIKEFKIDVNDMSAKRQARSFSVIADDNAIFSLEVKNELGHYYSFETQLFSATKARLNRKRVVGGKFIGDIVFPKVGDDDHYDIYLFAENGHDTFHSKYSEVRFLDDTLDINSSTGSNSSLLQKIIYQYDDTVLTMSAISPTGVTTFGSMGLTTTTIPIARGQKVSSVPFSIVVTAAASKAFFILKQPNTSDILSKPAARTFGGPVNIKGENTYPTATTAFTGDDINVSGGITSGSVVRMDNTDLSAVIKVGDKITTPVTTDTVNGARGASAVAVTMDAAVATKMAVGDQVTGNATLNAGRFTVASLDSTNVFSLSSAVAIADGVTLTFSSKINRSLTTVTVVETSGTATDFTMSQAIQFRDNAPLTFFNQMNYQWPISNFAHILKEGMVVVSSTNITADTSIRTYQDTVTEFPGTKNQKIIIKKEVSAISTLAIKPIITRGDISTQKGAVVFDKQQVLALGGTALKIGGYGQNEIFRVSGYDVVFSDLAIALTPITTTTTAASSGGSSASVVVASRNGILDDVSTVSGIGINPKLANPIVDSGAGAVTGAGTIVLDAVQSLESGATLTFPGAGQTATITGYIEVLKAGAANETLRFDVTKLLSIT